MNASAHRLFAGGALAAGAVTLGLATGGVAGVDEDLAAAAQPTPAPVVQERLVGYGDPARADRRDCPAPAPAPAPAAAREL